MDLESGTTDLAAAEVSLLKSAAHPSGGTAVEHTGPDPAQSTVTRLLCAAAYQRPQHAQVLRELLRTQRGKLRTYLAKKLLPKRIHDWLKEHSKKHKEEKNSEEPPVLTQPHVPVGHDYVRWVRRRIIKGRPVPSHGFDLAPVARICAAATWLLRLRRTLVLLSLGTAAGLLVTPISMWMSPTVAAAGISAACYLDRLLAHRRLRRLMESDNSDPGTSPDVTLLSRRRARALDSIRQLQSGVGVVPYRLEVRPWGTKHHFVGSGKVWTENEISVDVVPAKKDAPSGRSGKGDADGDDSEVRRAFHSVRELMDASKDVKAFTPDDLHEFVADQLGQPLKSQQPFHPRSIFRTFGVAAISERQWPKLNSDEHGALVTLAQEGFNAEGALRAPEVAGRFLCAQKIALSGELVASVYVGFAYEDHYLRVVIRPHVMNPKHPALHNAASQAGTSGWAWHVQAMLNSVLDVPVLLLATPAARRRLRRPKTDSGKGPVSLREVYSTRHMDDMLHYDNAKRYIDMMRQRIFTIVEDFLIDHNVDTRDYRELTTVVISNSIVNTGTGSISNAQNQVGNTNSVQQSGSSRGGQG